jgi:hypothetical protein
MRLKSSVRVEATGAVTKRCASMHTKAISSTRWVEHHIEEESVRH